MILDDDKMIKVNKEFNRRMKRFSEIIILEKTNMGKGRRRR